MLEYRVQTPEYQELLDFLKRSDEEFDSPLSAKVDLEEYARKLWEHSTVVTCRDNGVIVGMINCYTNRPPRGFISNVCVLAAYQGKGVFGRMFSMLCRESRGKGVGEIVLEVNKKNVKAINAYSKTGFSVYEDRTDSLYMIYEIPMVTVICCTYNHSQYISQCLDGFVMQEASFGFNVIVHDDASTDDTAAIIREYAAKYPKIIKPVYQKENQYSQKIDIFRTYVCPLIEGKYVAICEGDDYWVDPLKLQNQVDYMEEHPQVSVCATEGYVLNQASGSMSPVYDSKKILFTLKDLLRSNPISTVSTLSRSEWLMEYQTRIAPELPYFLMGDYPLWFYMAWRGPIALLKNKCFVYRELEESASHFKSPYKHIDFYISVCDIRAYFNSLLNVGKSFMIYRKFRDVRRECRRVVRAYGAGFWKLYFFALKKMIFHSAARPSKKAKAAISEILK